MMTITKQRNGRWMLEYEAPDGARIGGYRCSCKDQYEAMDKAEEFAKFAGIPMLVNTKQDDK